MPDTPTPEALAAARAAYDAAVRWLKHEFERYRSFLKGHRRVAGYLPESSLSGEQAAMTALQIATELGHYAKAIDYDVGDIVRARPGHYAWLGPAAIGIVLEMRGITPRRDAGEDNRQDVRILWADAPFESEKDISAGWAESWCLQFVTPEMCEAMIEAEATRRQAVARVALDGWVAQNAAATQPAPLPAADIPGAGPSA